MLIVAQKSTTTAAQLSKALYFFERTLGLDSVELVIAIEEEFGLTISDDEAAAMHTVGDVYYFVIDRLAGKCGHASEDDEDSVWERVKKIVVLQLRVKPDKVMKNSNFVKDLGMQ